MITLLEFWHRCQSHDFTWMMSDSGAVHSRGRKATKEMEALAQTSFAHLMLYQGFEAHHFSGGDHPKLPIPPKPKKGVDE